MPVRLELGFFGLELPGQSLVVRGVVAVVLLVVLGQGRPERRHLVGAEPTEKTSIESHRIHPFVSNNKLIYKTNSIQDLLLKPNSR